MVAYTSPDCLPYFQCTDSACLNTGSVCEHSSVFCDLVALLDARLTDVDNIIGRTTTAVPFAKVARNAVYTLNTNTPGYDTRIPFDTVLEDNFDMVNLDLNSKAILVSTPGIYLAAAYWVGTPPNVVSNVSNVYIGNQTGSFDAETDSLWRSGTNYANLAHQRLVTAANITNAGGQFPFSILVDFQGTIGTGIVTTTYAELTVYWVADAP